MIPMLGKEDKYKRFQNTFPLIILIFGLHVYAMSTYLIEISCLRRCKEYATICNNGFEALRKFVNARSTFEKSVVAIDSCRNMTLLKLGNIDKSPIEMWKEHQDNSKTKKRPLHLISREKIKQWMK